MLKLTQKNGKKLKSAAANEVKFKQILSNVKNANKILRQRDLNNNETFLSKKKTEKIHSAYNEDIAAQLIISKGATLPNSSQSAKRLVGW